MMSSNMDFAQHFALNQISNAELVDRIGLHTAEIDVSPSSDKRLELLFRHGTVEEVPLPVQTSHLRKQRALRLRFRPLPQ